MRECFKMMQILFEKTGYIYPIRAPSLANAGNLYRLSLTCVLPSSLLYYLKYKENLECMELNSIKISDLCSSKKLKNTEEKQLIDKLQDEENKELKGIEERTKDENDLETVTNKISYLETFFPQFLRDESVSIENSAFCVGEQGEFVHENNLMYFPVESSSDMKTLIYYCLVTCKYILKMVEMMKEELQLSFSCPLDELQEVSLPEMNWFNYRFKQLSKNERSSVFMAQIKTDEGWINHEFIKQYRENYAYVMELKWNTLVKNRSIDFYTNTHTLVMSIAHSCNIKDKTDLLTWLQSTALALEPIHKANRVHGDIKPQHILMKDDRICLIDFEFSVNKGDPINGCTKGFHPPEYDDFPNTRPPASTSAEIYSVALSGLYLLYSSWKEDYEKADNSDSTIEEKKEQVESDRVDMESKDAEIDKNAEMDDSENTATSLKIDINVKRNNLAKLVDYLEDQVLKSLLEKMLKTNPKERIKDATELIKELNKIESSVKLNSTNNITNQL